MRYQGFIEKYNVPQTNFLLYHGVSEAIKRYLKVVKLAPLTHKKIYASELWDCIMAGSRTIKIKLQEDNSIPTAVKKWNEIFINLKWNIIFKNAIKNSADSQLQWFQLRLIHRILPTKKYLVQCNLTVDSSCSFCGVTDETLSHLFWNCRHVKSFWDDMINFLHEKCIHCTRLYFKEELILFGSAEKIKTDGPMNFLILFAKFYIYKCKFDNIKPNLKTYLKQLQHRISIERALAFKSNKYEAFKNSWFVYQPLFTNENIQL